MRECKVDKKVTLSSKPIFLTLRNRLFSSENWITVFSAVFCQIPIAIKIRFQKASKMKFFILW
ncbi:hypothetical protein M769_0108190 [Bacillus haynesii]|uniref:Uncharacterized protein n=1 Tax=Bacillus haynesii TaxID=1925021 RepID=A0ABX3I4S2_9BACI|nr:hypothetical protein M769_0108190 [Bacillus haynesii]OMI27126.1 hypothetical protein BTA31_11435 [Bacillus haynesii]